MLSSRLKVRGGRMKAVSCALVTTVLVAIASAQEHGVDGDDWMCGTEGAHFDITGDGVVNVPDLLRLLSYFGCDESTCCDGCDTVRRAFRSAR